MYFSDGGRLRLRFVVATSVHLFVPPFRRRFLRVVVGTYVSSVPPCLCRCVRVVVGAFVSLCVYLRVVLRNVVFLCVPPGFRPYYISVSLLVPQFTIV